MVKDRIHIISLSYSMIIQFHDLFKKADGMNGMVWIVMSEDAKILVQNIFLTSWYFIQSQGS